MVKSSGFIKIDQNSFINDLKKVETSLEEKKDKNAQSNKDAAQKLWGLAEQIGFPAKPDVAYNALQVSRLKILSSIIQFKQINTHR